MKAAAELAELLLEKLKITGKPDLDAVCRELGLRVREVTSVGFDGTLVRSKSAQKGIIGVRESIREHGRKRFTVAHEIGHFVIPHHRLLKNVCGERIIDSYRSTLNKAELEANQFAAEFLLPAPAVRTRFEGEPSLARISSVAEEFETSLSATAHRFIDLTGSSVALLWQQDGKVEWFHKSDAFTYFLPLEELPSSKSMAGRLFAGGAGGNDFERVDPILWLSRRDAEKVDVVLEHSVDLPNYEAVLTLLWAVKTKGSAEEYYEEPYIEELDPEGFTLKRKRWPR